MTIQDLLRTWQACTACELHKTAVNHIVYQGVLPADILVIGESLRKQDEYGATGDATSFLYEFTLSCLSDEVKQRAEHIRWCSTTLVGCRPTNTMLGHNRSPTLRELLTCRPRVIDILALMERPRGIIAYGRVSQMHVRQILQATAMSHIAVLDVPHPQSLIRRGGMEADDYEEVQYKLNYFVQDTILPRLNVETERAIVHNVNALLTPADNVIECTLSGVDPLTTRFISLTTSFTPVELTAALCLLPGYAYDRT